MSAIHKSFHVYFGPMNLKYNWILKETFYFFEILTRNIPEKKKTQKHTTTNNKKTTTNNKKTMQNEMSQSKTVKQKT